jgi:exodeoxyribonuclease VII small subunit
MAKKKANPAKKSTEKGLDFEASLAEVEQIVARLESGELGLSESLQQYETGIKQLKRCHGLLDAAEQKVSLLSGFDADGNPITEPLDPLSQRTGSGRSVKRSQRTAEASSGEDPDAQSVDDGAGLF